MAAVAAAFEVGTPTVQKWLARFQAEGLPGLQDRPCRPKLVANRLAAPWISMIVRLRCDYRMTAAGIAERLHLLRSTVAGYLARLGLGQLSNLEPSALAWRYTRARAGELIHLDVKKLTRFRRRSPPGLGWGRLRVHPCRGRQCLAARLRRGSRPTRSASQ